MAEIEHGLEIDICISCGRVVLVGSGAEVGFVNPAEIPRGVREITWADLLVDPMTTHTGPCYTVTGWLVSRRRMVRVLGKSRRRA